MFSKRRDPKKLQKIREDFEKFPMLDVPKADIYKALDEAKNGLGLSDKGFELLRFLLKCTSVCDWCSESVPVSTVSNYRLMQEINRGRTQLKNLLRSLAEAGWIFFDDGPNYQRQYRDNYDGTDTIFGINVSPLSRRYHELCQIGEAIKEARREGNRLHREIQNVANYIYGIVNREGITLSRELAEDYGLEAFRLTRQRIKAEYDPLLLEPIYQNILALLERVEASVLQLESVDNDLVENHEIQPKVVETDPIGSIDRPQYTIQNPNNYIVKKEAHSVRYAQEKSSRNGKLSSLYDKAGPLGGFYATPEWILKHFPDFRDYCASSSPTESEIVIASRAIAHKLGISVPRLDQSDAFIGPYATAVAVGLIAYRHVRGLIQSPGGYLHGLIESCKDNTLHLERSLHAVQKA